MNKLNFSVALITAAFLMIFSMHVVAHENNFLTVDELVKSGYELLSGEQVLEIMNNRSIKVIDIETEAVSVSKKHKTHEAMGR